ncbi:MAG: putative sugar nucleotidyl transferase [Balneolaceae bacterium]
MSFITCYFEDEFLEHFHPLTLTRPLHDLRVGILTLGEKWEYTLNNNNSVKGTIRPELKGVFPEQKPVSDNETVLWINPRYLPTENLLKQIRSLKSGEGIHCDDHLIVANVEAAVHNTWLKTGINLDQVTLLEVDQTGLQNVWQLFQWNGQEIRQDLKRIPSLKVANSKDYPYSSLVNSDQIFIEDGAIIEPGAILIAESGPIYIGKGARLMANSVVRGSAAICEKSVVKMGAKIYEDTTIGPVCKVGGEVSNVIFHSYSNKAHDGYAGNSVFGQWCNIGADTNTSNLKNNYGTVKFRDWATGKELDTGQQFIGTIMGDHSKTGINAMLSTGTLCGVCCNLFSDGYPPKFVPSFSWVSGKDLVPYHFDKAIEAMEKMMKRRNVELTPAYRNMMETILESS